MSSTRHGVSDYPLGPVLPREAFELNLSYHRNQTGLISKVTLGNTRYAGGERLGKSTFLQPTVTGHLSLSDSELLLKLGFL